MRLPRRGITPDVRRTVVYGDQARLSGLCALRRCRKARRRLVPLAALEQFEADPEVLAKGGNALHPAYEKVLIPLDFHDPSASDVQFHRNAHPVSREIPDLTHHRHIRVAQNSNLADFTYFKSVFRSIVFHDFTSRFFLS
jgi:hypothetical protein